MEITYSEIAQIDSRLKACFEPINKILEDNGLKGKIGLEILHSHFPISKDEVMYESVNELERKVTFTPVNSDSINDDISFVSVWNPETGQPIKRCPRTHACHQILQ